MTLTFDLLTSKSIGRILDSWWVSVWSFMIIGWLQSQLSSGNHFQITMRHDLDLWPFDPKINRAHPWLMGSKCMKFHDHRWITESVIVRKLVWRTDRLTDRLTDRVQTYSPLRFHRWGTNNQGTLCKWSACGLCQANIVAAFRWMHVSPAKHSYAWLPKKCDYRTDGRTDAGQSDPYVPLCFAGDTKSFMTIYRLHYIHLSLTMVSRKQR